MKRVRKMKCECGFPGACRNRRLHRLSVYHRQHRRIKKLLSNDSLTLAEIGERLGITRERVRQIARQLLRLQGLEALAERVPLQVPGHLMTGLGLGFDDVAKFTTYLVHAQDIERFMRVRAELFPKLFSGPLYPPNTLLIVDRLVKEDFLIEVEAVARGRA
jgi:transcriptional regulator with XRE-family HTH domain